MISYSQILIEKSRNSKEESDGPRDWGRQRDSEKLETPN
jgi:hypothetical protein